MASPATATSKTESAAERYARLSREIEEAKNELESQKQNNLKTITDAFKKNLDAANISLDEAVTALGYGKVKASTSTQRTDGTGAEPQKGVTYKVGNEKPWTYSGRGAIKKPYVDAIAKGATWTSLVSK